MSVTLYDKATRDDLPLKGTRATAFGREPFFQGVHRFILLTFFGRGNERWHIGSAREVGPACLECLPTFFKTISRRERRTCLSTDMNKLVDEMGIKKTLGEIIL